MKISRKFCWGMVALLIFVGLILLAGGGLFGGSEEKGKGIAYFCVGGGLLFGLLLIIEWIIDVQKSSSEEEKAAERKGLCKQGKYYLQRRDKAKTKEEKGNWSSQWGIHKNRCPTCGGIKLVG